MKTFFDYFKRQKGDSGRASGWSGGVQSPFTPQVKQNPEDDTTDSGAEGVSEDSSGESGRRRNISLSECPPESRSDGLHDQDILLEVGDFIKRIPPEFLKPGCRNENQEVRFDVDEVANSIARGRATISLSEIARRCPEIFIDPSADHSKVEIYFPWQKLAKQVDILRLHRSKKSDTSSGLNEASGEGHSIRRSPNQECADEKLLEESQEEFSFVERARENGVEELEILKAELAILLENARKSENALRSEMARREEELGAARKQVETLRQELGDLKAGKSRASGEEPLEMEELRERADLLARERQTAIMERENAVAQLAKIREKLSPAEVSVAAHGDLAQKLEAASKRLDVVASERDKAVAEASESAEQQKKLIASLRAERDGAFTVRDEAVFEWKSRGKELQKKVSALQSERDSLRREKAQGAAQLEQMRTDHRKQIEFLNRDAEKRNAILKQRIETVKNEREAVLADLKKQRECSNKEIEVLRTERKVLIKAHEEALADAKGTCVQLQEHIDELTGERDALKRKLSAAAESMERLRAEHQAQGEKVMAERDPIDRERNEVGTPPAELEAAQEDPDSNQQR